jgi:hypothetical protein
MMLHHLFEDCERSIATADERLIHMQADTPVAFVRGLRVGYIFVWHCLAEAVDVGAERGNPTLALQDLASELLHHAVCERRRWERSSADSDDASSYAGGYMHALLTCANALQHEVAASCSFS